MSNIYFIALVLFIACFYARRKMLCHRKINLDNVCLPSFIDKTQQMIYCHYCSGYFEGATHNFCGLFAIYKEFLVFSKFFFYFFSLGDSSFLIKDISSVEEYKLFFTKGFKIKYRYNTEVKIILVWLKKRERAKVFEVLSSLGIPIVKKRRLG